MLEKHMKSEAKPEKRIRYSNTFEIVHFINARIIAK